MKRQNPGDLPMSLHTPKVLARVAALLALRDGDRDPVSLVVGAASVLGYELAVASVRAEADPAVAQALKLVRKALGTGKAGAP